MKIGSAEKPGTMSEKDNVSEWKDFGKFLLKLAAFMFILRSLIVSPFNIPSESMQPRLLIGDYLLVTKWNYGYSKYSFPFSLPIVPGRIFANEPKAGDVVVFKAPPTQQDDYIKRVIGLPGDQIEMRSGVLIINGEPVRKTRIEDFVIPVSQNMIDAVEEKRRANALSSEHVCSEPRFEEAAKDGGTQCRYPRYRETLPNGRSYEILDLVSTHPGDNIGPFIVDEGHMFLMGDNRDRSSDSRFPAESGGAIGIVPQENLVGRAWVTVFSTDGSANWLLPWTWFSAARGSRIGNGF